MREALSDYSLLLLPPGLESPERISLVYPTPIAARLNFTASKPDIKAATIFEPKAGLVNVDEVRQLASLCLRLEALSSAGQAASPGLGAVGAQGGLVPSSSQADNRVSRYSVRNPDLLLPSIGPERTDDELLQILDSRESPSSFLLPCKVITSPQISLTHLCLSVDLDSVNPDRELAFVPVPQAAWRICLGPRRAQPGDSGRAETHHPRTVSLWEPHECAGRHFDFCDRARSSVGAVRRVTRL